MTNSTQPYYELTPKQQTYILRVFIQYRDTTLSPFYQRKLQGIIKHQRYSKEDKDFLNDMKFLYPLKTKKSTQ